jgi:hypothetical protein
MVAEASGEVPTTIRSCGTLSDPDRPRPPVGDFSPVRHLLSTFARSLNFAEAATELGITQKAMRSRLERLKAKQVNVLEGAT